MKTALKQQLPNKSIQEECGVFGIYKNDENIDIVSEVYNALFALQHRGHEAAGIAVNNSGEIKCAKNRGVVSEALTPKALKSLGGGKIAVGHVRYHAEEDPRDVAGVQPLVLRYIKGSLALAHNGAITNIATLRKQLEQGGAIFQSSSNAELIAYVIARNRLETDTIEKSVLDAMNQVEGAYSIVLSAPSKLIAFRDKYGFRPLSIGKMGSSYLISSETCVYDSLGAKFIRDVEPGEMVVVDENGLSSYKQNAQVESAMCMFEHIYIARPDSVLDGVSVHQFRVNAGIELAKQCKIDADLVCGVPDSGVSSAIGYSQQSGVPYGMAIIKNKYISRSIDKHQSAFNERLLEIKINVLNASVKGKRVIVIDDSIVRGNTCAYIVKLLKDAGAKEVHYLVASPPFTNPCYYGTDIRSIEKLIARTMNTEQLRASIGADSLHYLEVNSMGRLAPESKVGFCTACFTGEYPAPIPTEVYEDKFRKKLQK